ncbi:hypothetical protein C8F04DRAFT_1255818 [Mycena alexandri]|uniref:Uncharacterized protein n=1 Tax=Mycena alexandri TaxID=1745969 RepID=A0AAD6T2K4_9AGAR|nr:hypothetical protein C8F04DRAFT_1255818 [Mycena alexandri]
MDKFTFTWQIPSALYDALPPSPSPAPRALPPPVAGPSTTGKTPSSRAQAQVKYREKNEDAEKVKACERMRKIRAAKKPSPTYTSDELKTLSSKDLRASKTFAAFRDYARAFLIWVVVDDDNVEEVAAYHRFMENCITCTADHDLAEDVETVPILQYGR